MNMFPPPTLGLRIPAGLGHATIIPDIDFETYSEAGYVWDDERQRWAGPPGAPKNQKGLPVVGAEPYAAHPSCGIIWLAYDLKDGLGKRRWRPGLAAPIDLLGYLSAGGPVEAWNVGFERWIWKNHCVPQLGWPAVHDSQWRCAMAKARAAGLPGNLAAAGSVLNLSIQKDKRGGALMTKFSMPRQPTKSDPRRRVLPSYAHPGHEGLRYKADRDRVDSDYEDTEAYGQYNVTDIASEAEASGRIPDLEGEELLWWQCHERINQRGVHIDLVGVENCIAVVEQVFLKYNGELLELTGVDSASKVQQLQGWLHARGVHLDSLDEEAVENALTWPTLPPDARRVLEIRAAAGSASVKKLFSMRNRLSADSRLRDLYIFSGARTGRSTGEGPQPTNLPKAGPDTIKCGCGKHYGLHLGGCPFCGLPRAPGARVVEWNPDVAEQALQVMAWRSLPHVERIYGDALLTVAGCLRALFTAAPGCDLVSTDYNSIEAVGLAMISGEAWRVAVFRGDGKIYERSASAAFRVAYEEFAAHKALTGQHHPLRQKGKVMELACVSPDTQVLTDVGYLPIVDVSLERKLWDGVEWVSHAGVVPRGHRLVIDLGGARMTPEHLVLCGTSWLEASRLASSESTHSLCLETGSANLPSWASRGPATGCASGLGAPAAPSPTSSPRQTSERAEQPAARSVPTGRPAAPSRSTLRTPTSSPMTSIGVGCSIASPRHAADASGPATPSTPTTAGAESGSRTNGCETSERFSGTRSRLPGGTTPPLNWTGETSTEGTNLGTSGSSPGEKTQRTSDASAISIDASENWSDVYDIALAGPRNRFTILTNEGHLIVHNCGYQGWVGAALAFEMPGTEDQIKADILAWRAASPAVEWLWGGQTVGKATGVVNNATAADYKGAVDDRLLWLQNSDPRARWDKTEFLFGVEGKAVQAMLAPGQWFDVARLDGTASGIEFLRQDDALYCKLPSARVLTYRNPVMVQGDRGEWSLSYEGWNTNPKNGPKGWIRMDTWGGRLVENIIQATCRDVLRACCIELELAGYPVVLHTYDEPVSEVPEAFGSVEEYERICTERVIARCPWAADWPIRAPGGYRAKRYRKG